MWDRKAKFLFSAFKNADLNACVNEPKWDRTSRIDRAVVIWYAFTSSSFFNKNKNFSTLLEKFWKQQNGFFSGADSLWKMSLSGGC